MSQDARISSRIDHSLKIKSEAILLELGIKPSQAITMFYTQIVKQRGLPLELKLPNDETLSALEEDLSNAKSFDSVDALFEDLDADN